MESADTRKKTHNEGVKEVGDVKINSKQVEETKEKAQPSKWASLWIRTITSLVMLFCFFIMLWLGHIALSLMVNVLQALVFKELVFFGWKNGDSLGKKNFVFRYLHWYFFSVYFFFSYARYWKPFLIAIERSAPENINGVVILALTILRTYHNFITYWLFIIGFVTFVLNLRKGQYRLQFNYLFRIHLALFGVIRITTFFVSNIFQGIIWFVLPAIIIISNDTGAYFVGKAFGRTPLIRISPRKTWEGFIGGFFITILVAFFLGRFFAGYKFFTCPQDFSGGIWYTDCDVSTIFVDRSYEIPQWLAHILRRESVKIMPFQLHSIALAVFGGLIAPFGGFFASGLKRGFEVKDFADVIPGHGGFSDRFDCHIMMALFVFVYIKTFVTAEDTVTKMVRLFMKLSQANKIAVFEEIKRIMTQ